jgi:hypothetical protein
MLFKEELFKFLNEKTGLAHWDGAGRELICRCPFPGCEVDQLKKGIVRDHGHLYISSTDPVFFCQKCNTKGSIFKLIRFLGGKLEDYVSPEFISDSKNSVSYKRYENFGMNKLHVPELQENNYSNKKKYLLSRIGNDFEVNKIPGLVFNLREFINENKIDLSRYSPNLIEYLESNFIGFIASRGTKIVCRNLDPKSNFEYFKINIIDDNYFRDVYGVFVKQFMGKSNTVVLCEGVFDLLVGITDNKLKEIKEASCFWGAVLSHHYEKSIVSVLDLCKIPMAKFIILSDGNINVEEYYKITKNPSVISLEVYYNRLGEDFGERPIELIKVPLTKGDKFNGKYSQNAKNFYRS